MLKRIPELAVKPIASSCCGMAGSFGYQAETQDGLARDGRGRAAAGGARGRGTSDIIVADGTSCRHQIRDLGGREASPFRAAAGARVGMTTSDATCCDFWFAGDPSVRRKIWFEKNIAFDSGCNRFVDTLRAGETGQAG